MSVQNILERNRREVITIRANESLQGAANRMHHYRIGALVVKTDDAVTGLISERDIIHAISLHGQKALTMMVQDIASRSIITIDSADTVKRAMSLMTHHRLRHLLVVEEGKPVGIVSIGDVVRHRLEDLETESNVLRDAYISAH
jgi:CBS domain-containing protein